MSKLDLHRQRPVSVALTDVALHNEFEKERERERDLGINRVSAFPQGMKPKDASPLQPSSSIPRNDSSLHRGIRVKAIASGGSNSFPSLSHENPSHESHGSSHLRESSPGVLALGIPPSTHPSHPHLENTLEDSLLHSGEALLKGQKPQLNKIRGGKVGGKRRRSILPHLDSPDGVPQIASSPSMFASQQQDHSLSSPYVQVQVQVQMTTKSEYGGGGSDLVSHASLPSVAVSQSVSSAPSTAGSNSKVLLSSVSTCDLQNMRLKKLPLWDVRRTPGVSETLSVGRAAEGTQIVLGSSHPSEISPLHLAGYQLMSFPDDLPDLDRSTAMISHLHPMQFYERLTSSTDESFLFTFMRRHDLTFDSKREEFAPLTQSLSRLCIDRLPQSDRIPKASLVIHGGKYTGIPFVKSGTTNSLFRMLCDDVTRGANAFSFIEASLLLTYPLFSSTDLVLSTFGYIIASHLQNRKTAKELKSVGDALYHWVGLVPEDFEGIEGAPSLKKLNYLLSQCHSPPIAPLSFMDRNRQFLQRVRSVAIPPLPILPMNLHGGFQSLSLMVLDPVEVSRQMALRSFRTFELISPREWLNTKHVDTDHISTLSKEFNYLANFFAEAILESSDANVRAEVIIRCIAIAEASLKLRNFHTFMAILCSLNCAAVSRLQRTWKAVKKNKEMYAKYAEMEAIGEMENNFVNLREICVVTPDVPSIPYLGLFLSDITFIIDGNRKVPVPLDHINFEMIQMIGEIQLKIRVMQSTPYNFEEISFIQDYIYDRTVADGNRLYDTSLKHEPRVAKETIAPPKEKKSFSRRMSLFFTQNEMEAKLKKFAEENRENISFASSVPRDNSSLYPSPSPSPSSTSSSPSLPSPRTHTLPLSPSSSSSNHSLPSYPSAAPALPPGLSDSVRSSDSSFDEEREGEKNEEEESVTDVTPEDAGVVKGIPPGLARGMRPKRKLGKSLIQPVGE